MVESLVNNPLVPLLTEEENLIKKLLKPNYRYLEWGCGRSTEVFSPLVSFTLSIEHDKEWGEYISKKNLLNVKIVITDSWIKYINTPKNYEQFDFILIDGRFRVECAYAILDNKYLKQDGVVMIHDWERLRYKELLNRYDVIYETKGIVSGETRHKGLGVLKPKFGLVK